MKSKEEIIEQYLEKFSPTFNIVSQENALKAMDEFAKSVLEDYRNAYDSREPVVHDIISERQRQDAKWGVQYHNLPEWIAILTEEVGEASKEAVDYHFENDISDFTAVRRKQSNKIRLQDFRKELIQVAAVAVQIVEHIDQGEKFKEDETDEY